MHLQDFPPSAAVRAIDQNLAVESSLSLLGLLGRAVLRFFARAFAAVFEAKELEKAPGRLGLRILWRFLTSYRRRGWERRSTVQSIYGSIVKA
jgi:hypothetical protein